MGSYLCLRFRNWGNEKKNKVELPKMKSEEGNGPRSGKD